jgi:hypothetical protein
MIEFDDTFNIVSIKIKDLMQISLIKEEYDAVMVKNIALSNAGEKYHGRSHQDHIALTGDEKGFFPLLYNNMYSKNNIADAKRFYLCKIPVLIKKEAVAYLGLTDLGVDDIDCYTTTVLSRNDTQVELGDKKNDSNEWNIYRSNFEEKGFVIFLKKIGLLKFEVYFIKPTDISDLKNGVATIDFRTKGNARTLIDINENTEHMKKNQYQKIFFGSPGTGKSHKVDYVTGNQNIRKVTFYPDYDYNSFVGCYKPSMTGKTIGYKFVPQIFTNIYIDAWKKPDEEFYLQIEEINRGNCSEIFGDLFQLLDRDENGVSRYAVDAEAELLKHLKSSDGFDSEEHDGIKNSQLRLPSNLKIIATMNTSDQSLFPMDSAFKRRWDWEYVPINYDCKYSNFVIKLENEKKIYWLQFLKKINQLIFEITNSEDKQIGNWFINARHTNDEISEELFLNKVIFYLWNDIFKEEESSLFTEKDGKKITYASFFNGNNEDRTDLINTFLVINLDLEPIE